MNQQPVIDVRELAFSYGPRRALQGVSFSVREREIFVLLGPNGGGKTTLFRLLCTLLRPESGKAFILGREAGADPMQVRRLIGVVFQSNSLDLQLTVQENLTYQGRLYGLRGKLLHNRMQEMLARLGLTERRYDLVRELSGGYRRRVELAKGLLHRPPVLLLDEPTIGLDPGVRRDLWEYLRMLREREGVTILLTTHLMEEAERCDRLAILSEGHLVAAGTPDELKERIGGDVIVIQCREPERLRGEIEAKFGFPATLVDGTVRLERRRGHEFVPQLVERFPGEIEAITVGKPNLEDVFVHETGHRFWDQAPP
ncbi:MAG: ABC transporter ATP-binding protein [Acidobacteria bacterium]|nr:ABC transporter ATP-binding protein [Acidobacteriota bacterium]